MDPAIAKLNRYTCDTCCYEIVTIERQQGVTPMFLACKSAKRCTGMMVSAMYRGVVGLASFEWRTPTKQEYRKLPSATKNHGDLGGLIHHATGHLP